MRKKWKYVKNPQYSGSIFILGLAVLIMFFKAIWFILPFVLIALFVVIVIFIISHLRPLDDIEINNLASKRRDKDIQTYYSFSKSEFQIDANFKKNMNSSGKFYKANESLFNFPSIASAMLKHKKHEWIIIAFEKDFAIDLIWVNKGQDKTSALLFLPIEEIVDISINNGYLTVLMFHNHPNSLPHYIDCSKPSDIDIKTAQNFAEVLNKNGINHIAFICERGIYYEYFMSISDNFKPIKEYIEKIKNENNSSIFKNLSLHIEKLL